MKKAFSADTKAGPTIKPPVRSQSSQCCRPAGKKAFSAVARLPVLSRAVKKASSIVAKVPVLARAVKPSVCRKAVKPSMLSHSSQRCRSTVKKSPMLSQSSQCCRKAVKKASSAGAKLPVLLQSCEDNLQWCRKALSAVAEL